MSQYGVHICNFASHAGDLRGRALTYENVKRLVLAAGRFSVFEATETKKRAELYTMLHHDPELVCDNSREYPWIYVTRKAGTATPVSPIEIGPLRSAAQK